jgi:hypothetical protein
MRKLGILVAAVCIAGCGSSAPDPAVARGADVELTTRAIDRALGAGTLFVSMGVIAPNMPADVNASALYQRVMTETNGCAVPTRTGTTLDVDLSAGCTLASTNVVYGGSLHAEVSKPATSTILIQATLDLLVDGSQPLTGTLFIQTIDGSTFTYQAGLTLGGVLVSVPNLRAGIASFGATFDATGTLTGKTGMYTLTISGVHQRFAGCYADDGTVEIAAPMMGMTPALDEVWTFASDAPQTGNVAVGTNTVKLPARTGCPTSMM